MSEPSVSAAPAPALPSTADEAPYVPVSWLAVSAAACAALLAGLLAIMGLLAFRSRRPLLEEELFIPLAVIAVVLSFAARRVIRNSEGTRTGTLFGIDLPNAAWWGGLVLGLGYCSYLLAIEYSIDRDSKTEVQAWIDNVLKGDQESMNRAFLRTQDPGQRKGIQPTDTAMLEGRWGREYVAFNQSDLARLLKRNPGSKIEVGGLKRWEPKPAGIECVVAATLTCPEGLFLINIPLRGFDPLPGSDAGGRQWKVLSTPNGFIDKDRARLTAYGWLMVHLTYTGAEYTRRFMGVSSSSREARCTAFLDFHSNADEHVRFFKPVSPEAAQARSAAVGALAGYNFRPGPEFLHYSAKILYKLPDGGEPDASRAKAFAEAWDVTGIVKAGERLRDSADINDAISMTDTAIYYRSPIEIPLTATRGDVLAAKGGVVLICDDPKIVQDAKRLRESGTSTATLDRPPEGLASRTIPWRLQRIESDMKPVKMEMRGPGPPGGMPPGGMPPGGMPPGGMPPGPGAPAGQGG